MSAEKFTATRNSSNYHQESTFIYCKWKSLLLPYCLLQGQKKNQLRRHFILCSNSSALRLNKMFYQHANSYKAGL